MLLDVSSLFAKDLNIVSGTPEVLYLGEKGLGHINGIRFFVEISEKVEGLNAVTFRLFAASDEAGTENKEEILLSPAYKVERLKKGFSFMIELPATQRPYLILEVEKDGTATAGKYWAGLTSSEQYAAHNI